MATDLTDTNEVKIFSTTKGAAGNTKVFKLFYFTLGFYCLPFFSLLLFVLDQLTVNKTEMLFWLIFLVSLVPCAVIGIVLCIWGLIKSYRVKSKLNMALAFIGLFLGLGGIAAGVLGLLLIYAVVN